MVANATVYKQGSVQRLRLLADLNFQSFNGLYKNFTRKFPSEFKFLINLIGGKNLGKEHRFQESLFCSRKVGTDATFLV